MSNQTIPDPQRSTDLYQACRVGLTRDRVRQLGL